MRKYLIILAIIAEILTVKRAIAQQWTTYTTSDGLVNNGVQAIAVDSKNTKWFGTAGGVSKFDGKIWTNFTTADGLGNYTVVSMAIDKYGDKWFGTGFDGGLTKYNDSVWITYKNPSVWNVFTSISFDRFDNIWLGISDYGAAKFDGNTWTNFTSSDGLAENHVYAVAIDSQNIKWFGTYAGISKFDDSSWTTFTKLDSLNTITSIAIDSQGVKWFGTWGGVLRYDGKTWTTFTVKDGLAKNYVTSIAIDQMGKKWFGTFGGGVSNFNDSIWKTYSTANGLPDNYIGTIAVDKENCIWAGTTNGVSKLNSEISVEKRGKKNENEVPLRVSPNPFIFGASFRYSIEKDAQVKIEIFRINGEFIRNLYSGLQKSGTHLINWDARTRNGFMVPSGLYFVEMKLNNKNYTRKIILGK